MRRTMTACAVAGVVTALASACTSADRPSAQPTPAAPGTGTATTSAPVYATACPPWPDMPTGRIAYTQTRRGGTDALYLMKPDGTDRRCLIDTVGPDSYPAWSPDGKWIAFIGGTAQQDDVYLVRADGTRLRQLTRTAEFDEGPVWSPDGTRIGYSSFPRRDGGPHFIHVMDRDGSDDTVILRTGGEIVWAELKDWSPDGKTLLYNADAGNGGLWAMRPDGTGRRLLRSGPGDFGTEAVYSPDGRSIAFGAELNGGCIYRSDPQARRLVRLTKNCVPAYVLSWSPDGRWIAWAGGAHGPADAEVMASDGSQRHTIADGGDVAFVAWQPTTTG